MKIHNTIAFILAAGLGTRLRPLTHDKPKALVEIHGKTLLQINLENLASQGINKFVINIHHFGDLVIQYLEKNKNFGLDISISDERNQLLNTGGALKKSVNLLSQYPNFIIYNVDILTDLDINLMYQQHQNIRATVTLATRIRNTSRYLLFDSNNNQLIGWENQNTGEKIIINDRKEYINLAFSGVAIFRKEALSQLPASKQFSLIDLLLQLSKNHKIYSRPTTNGYWFDTGTHQRLAIAKEFFRSL